GKTMEKDAANENADCLSQERWSRKARQSPWYQCLGRLRRTAYHLGVRMWDTRWVAATARPPANVRSSEATMIGEAILRNSYSGLLRFFLLAVCTLALPNIIRAQTDKPLPVMPLPAEVVRGDGEFLIDENFGIILTGYKEPRLERARQ